MSYKRERGATGGESKMNFDRTRLRVNEGEGRRRINSAYAGLPPCGVTMKRLSNGRLRPWGQTPFPSKKLWKTFSVTGQRKERGEAGGGGENTRGVEVI